MTQNGTGFRSAECGVHADAGKSLCGSCHQLNSTLIKRSHARAKQTVDARDASVPHCAWKSATLIANLKAQLEDVQSSANADEDAAMCTELLAQLRKRDGRDFKGTIIFRLFRMNLKLLSLGTHTWFVF